MLDSSLPALAGKITLGLLASVVGLGLLGLALLLAASPGRARPVLGADGRPLPGSISEKVFITVNGSRQGIFLKGKDRTKPVLLYLHGGMPDYFLTERYPTGLEELFVVAWWEQRGSGISYDPAAAERPVTLDLMVKDTLAVADWLRARFGAEKVYLMGHSGGSFVGIHAAARAPEKFAAYVAVAQMAEPRKSEALAYEYMLREYRERGDARMVRRLERFPVGAAGDFPAGYAMTRDVAMHDLGVGTTRGMRSIARGLLLPSLAFPEYGAREKWRFWAAKARSGIASLWGDMLSAELPRSLPRLELPVYFLHGAHDYTCSYPLAKAYLQALEAPAKGFYTFPEAAHSPLFEDPARLREILGKDVLAGKTELADR